MNTASLTKGNCFIKSIVNLQKRVTENCFRLPATKTNFDEIERKMPFVPNQKNLTQKKIWFSQQLM